MGGGMSKQHNVTSAGVNPAEDRAHRMKMYFLAMSLRMVCVVSLFWVQGWWILLVAAGAILLPWFAVMIGNAVAYGGEESREAVPSPAIESPEVSQGTESNLVVVDVEPVRRSNATTNTTPHRERDDVRSQGPASERRPLSLSDQPGHV